LKTTRLIVVAVGGQGNLLATKVLGEAALISGVPVRMSEIHGMAQRGGVVESSMVFGDAESTLISDGKADVLVGFEPCETLRALKKCNKETIVVTNLSPLPPFTVTTGQGVYPDLEETVSLTKKKVRRLIAFDAVELAKKAGSTMSVNMVLLGALLKTGVIPISANHVKEAIMTKTKKELVSTNLTAFDLGFDVA
jgi:indolepyruvate ferredoxin oxidoreductase beta subunit